MEKRRSLRCADQRFYPRVDVLEVGKAVSPERDLQLHLNAAPAKIARQELGTLARLKTAVEDHPARAGQALHQIAKVRRRRGMPGTGSMYPSTGTFRKAVR